MTKQEFLALPAAVRLEVIFDVLHDRLVSFPVPTSTSSSAPAPAPTGDSRPPRFDAKIGRKGGFVFASEMLLADLIWWHQKKTEGAASGGQYAAKDQKTADELARFIAWRKSAPAEIWHGTRGDESVMAEPPSRDPALHPWSDRSPQRLAPPPSRADGRYSDDDFGGAGDDDVIPF